MFEIILEMESDKEKRINAPDDWGTESDGIAEKLCELLENAKEEEATFVCINDVIVRVENVWGARIYPKSSSGEGNVISFPPRR